MTRPASIAACALARLSNRPRSTSRRSIASFVGGNSSRFDSEPLSASFTVSAAASLPSASNTLATMPLASRPALAYIAAGESWSRKTSGSTMQRIFKPQSSTPLLGQRLQHIGAEAADRAFLDGDQHLVLARQPQHQVGVERLGKARVGDRGRQAERGQFVGRLQGIRRAARRSDSSATLWPSRRMRPLPISSGMPSAGIGTPTPSPRG